MPDMNQMEYQTVILGALLHDVGKLEKYFRCLGLKRLNKIKKEYNPNEYKA